LIAAAVFALLACVRKRMVSHAQHGSRRDNGAFRQRPRGAAEMTILGERFGARSDRVVLAQSLRVLIVVVIVPFAFTLLGVHGADVYRPGQLDVDV